MSVATKNETRTAAILIGAAAALARSEVNAILYKWADNPEESLKMVRAYLDDILRLKEEIKPA